MRRASHAYCHITIPRLLQLSALSVLLSACVPQLPDPAAQQHQQVSYQQTERAIALLPGVRRVVVTATAAVVTADANTGTATITSDIARITGLPTSAIVVRPAPTTVSLLKIGPWTVAASSRWPLVGAAVALLGLLAIATGFLAWRIRPRSRR